MLRQWHTEIENPTNGAPTDELHWWGLEVDRGGCSSLSILLLTPNHKGRASR